MRRAYVFLLLAPAALATAVGCKASSAANASEGAALFAASCARCHGDHGSGGLPLWEGGPAPRNLREHDFQASRTDAQLKDTIVHGKGAGMPPFGKTFDDAQLAALVAYVRSLDLPPGRGK